MSQQPQVSQSLLVIEASRSHSQTPQSVELLWTSDQPDEENSTWQNTTLTRDKTSMSTVGFQPTFPASERPNTQALDRAATEISRRCTHVERFEQLYRTDAANGSMVLCEDERISLCVRMNYTWFWNVCLQTCYNTTIMFVYCTLNPLFLKTHYAYDVIHALILSAYNFHGTKDM